MKYNESISAIPMPARIKALPISPTGYPVPWFVTWFCDGKECEDGKGAPDFRVVGFAAGVRSVPIRRS